MSMLRYEEKKILIWGKIPTRNSALRTWKLSARAAWPRMARPSPLCPILQPLSARGRAVRTLPMDSRPECTFFTDSDPRLESHRIDYDSIQVGEAIPTDKNGWSDRAAVMFKNSYWQFESVDDLLAAQKKHKISIGVVNPREIFDVSLFARPDEGRGLSHRDKLDRMRPTGGAADREQQRLFEEYDLPELKGLEFVSNRIRVSWLCHSPTCAGHKMQILDWGTIQLQRKVGDQKALDGVRAACDLKKNDVRFFSSATHTLINHPSVSSEFGIRKRVTQLQLFAKEFESN